MLFQPERHESLSPVHWNPQRAHDSLSRIVDDVQLHMQFGGRWAEHPLDLDGDAPPATGWKSLYQGAAGVLWALWYLRRQGAATLRIDPAALIEEVDAAYQREPDTGEVVPSYFLGEAGIALLRWRMAPSPDVADRLWQAVESNLDHPSHEALWGAPGTMLASWAMLQWTGETRWRDQYLRNVAHVWATWTEGPVLDGKLSLHRWEQDMYGHHTQYLGAGHGFAGNVFALLRGAALLPDGQRQVLRERTVDLLRVAARREEGAVNWLPDTASASRPKILMQWCHGAPGIVTSLAGFPREGADELDELLLQAGEAVWRAGPVAKGHGLCHGTAGNGYALLALHRRTSDPLWLERARRFAMHAIGQCEAARKTHGMGRYTLWNGDPGLAVFLWHCLQGSGGLPTLDVLD